MEKTSVKIKLDVVSLLIPASLLASTAVVMFYLWFFLLYKQTIFAVVFIILLLLIILKEMSVFPIEILFNENEIIVINIFSASTKSLYSDFLFVDETSYSLNFKESRISLRHTKNGYEILEKLSGFLPEKSINLQRNYRKEFSVRNQLFVILSILSGGLLLVAVYFGYDFVEVKYIGPFIALILLGIMFLSDRIGKHLIEK